MNMLKTSNEIITKEKLSQHHIEDLNSLIAICNKEDSTNLDFSFDNFQDDITKFLIYDNNTLVSYLAVTDPNSNGLSYCWGTIDPLFRNSDFYSKLFDLMKNKCLQNNISTLKVVVEKNADDFKSFILSSNGNYSYSTYKMNFHKESYSFNTSKAHNIVLTKASIEDLNYIIPIGMEAFETSEEAERDYNEVTLKDSKCTNFIGRVDDKPVGIISTRIESNVGSIADLGVLISYRRQGIGRSILSKAIEYLLDKGIENFSLSVETENKNALSLYEDCGFRVDTINDCYDIKL